MIFLKDIFFRNGVLSQLETQRDERLAGMVVHLQAHCRGYLSRRRLAQRKLQDLAVRCIQRNVRKFLAVRDWPWWRLLVRVTPLLNVHRTEEELRLKTDELEAIKIKLEKLEFDRTKLKHENDKLEGKLGFPVQGGYRFLRIYPIGSKTGTLTEFNDIKTAGFLFL
ncbi:hypothetical protein NQ317_000549 [Molorchus minor]|uniref:Myosin heavy chain n=1 Tax=Molorchus minor TaxID=1323400 RepID=A0ABQ9JSF0_9CUCU|nr:hypothetical protein NQ317_000549 [Molorchus minor]